MLLNCVQKLFELVLVILCHVLEVVLESARVICHPLHLEFDLSVVRDSLFICDHFLMDLVPQLSQLLL